MDKSRNLGLLVDAVEDSDIRSSMVVMRGLMRLFADSRTGAFELKNELEKDAAICARILQRANSAIYGTFSPSMTVRDAIVRLGFDAVKEIAVAATAGKMYDGGITVGQYSRHALWEHSLAVAVCAKAIYRWEFKESGDVAYTCALMHDLGLLAEEQAMPGLFRTLMLWSPDSSDVAALEKDILGFSHGEANRALMTKWGFPPPVVEVCTSHHNPFSVSGEARRMTMVVFVAEHVCSMMDLGKDCLRRNDADRFKEALAELGLKPKAMISIGKEVFDTLERIKEND